MTPACCRIVVLVARPSNNRPMAQEASQTRPRNFSSVHSQREAPRVAEDIYWQRGRAWGKPTGCWKRPIDCAERRVNDVVLGFVETHGRAETVARSATSRRVPLRANSLSRRSARGDGRRRVSSRASPGYAVVDELAHTNAPGSRHNKRFQDVEELIAKRYQRNHRVQHPASGESQPDGAADNRGRDSARPFPILF